MEYEKIAEAIVEGNTCLGIELGSTRIKAVLIGQDCDTIASGAYDWENQLENGIWTYRLSDVWTGIQAAYAQLNDQVKVRYGTSLTKVGALGFSAMMHGYLPFDKNGAQLSEFRTWRNTTTERAAAQLTELFGFNIPQRWSIAHLYEAILNGEEHVKEIAFLTTLAGYIHWQMTGQKVLGVGEASGMFPVDYETGDYNARMVKQFDGLLQVHELAFRLKGIMPQILPAGQVAGTLTAAGALLLDPTGTLQAGVPLCPPEGDAGTGMVATNSVAPRTGNVSAGTSVFAMIVLEKALSKVYPELDMVATPSGMPVAMVHCNTCTSDLDAWARLLGEMAGAAGVALTKTQLYEILYAKALEGAADCGGLVNYNYYSGEPVTGLDHGCPLFLRSPTSTLNLANFMRVQLYSSMATLKLGMDILFRQEGVMLNQLLGHGGLFKVKGVAQKLMAGALNVPVSVMETAGEGGPWGMALLASYMLNKAEDELLENYLAETVFAGTAGICMQPDTADSVGFAAFMERYKAALTVEKAAVTALRG